MNIHAIIDNAGLRTHRDVPEETRLVVCDLCHPDITILFEVYRPKLNGWHCADSLTITREQAAELGAAILMATGRGGQP